LVSKRVIVTAAHVIQNKNDKNRRVLEDFTIYMGKYSINDLNEKGYVARQVENFFKHPDWNPAEDNYNGDIAIIILTTYVEFSKYIIPLCIYDQTQDYNDILGKKGTIAGNFF
jgi:Trypsin